LTMILALLYGLGAIGVGIYMLVALIRPEKF
jgi:K+-transporting ATPase KdpF subunit